MKIILSGAGGGKSRKATKLAAQYAVEGKTVHIVSGEVVWRDFAVSAYEQGFNIDVIEKIKYTFIDGIKEALEVLGSDDSDVVFLDEVVSNWHLKDIGMTSDGAKNELLSTLDDMEKEGSKKFYVTQQARYEDIRLNGERLAMFDYVSTQ